MPLTLISKETKEVEAMIEKNMTTEKTNAKYHSPSLEIISLGDCDIIRTSDWDLPEVPFPESEIDIT